MRVTIAILQSQIDHLRKDNENKALIIMRLESENRFYKMNERRYDQLLQGMCDGMKEAIFPRRPA